MPTWIVTASFQVIASTSDRAEDDLAEYLDCFPPEYGISAGEVLFGKSVQELDADDDDEGGTHAD